MEKNSQIERFHKKFEHLVIISKLIILNKAMNIYKILNKNGRKKNCYTNQETLDKRKKNINYKIIKKKMTLDMNQLEDWLCWSCCPY